MEQIPNNDLDFTKNDFTSPEAKITDLENQLHAVERGISLAENLKDEKRSLDLSTKRNEIKATLQELGWKDVEEESSTKTQPSESYDWGGDQRESRTL